MIKYRTGEMIKESLKVNKRITKVQLDYNPIKQQVIEQIDALCKRNQQLDQITQKTKNMVELAR